MTYSLTTVAIRQSLDRRLARLTTGARSPGRSRAALHSLSTGGTQQRMLVDCIGPGVSPACLATIPRPSDPDNFRGDWNDPSSF